MERIHAVLGLLVGLALLPELEYLIGQRRGANITLNKKTKQGWYLSIQLCLFRHELIVCQVGCRSPLASIIAKEKKREKKKREAKKQNLITNMKLKQITDSLPKILLF
jgi:hypothetical protein